MKPHPAWYGFDPIHIGTRYQFAAWSTILAQWSLQKTERRAARLGLRERFSLRRLQPQHARCSAADNNTCNPPASCATVPGSRCTEHVVMSTQGPRSNKLIHCVVSAQTDRNSAQRMFNYPCATIAVCAGADDERRTMTITRALRSALDARDRKENIRWKILKLALQEIQRWLQLHGNNDAFGNRSC